MRGEYKLKHKHLLLYYEATIKIANSFEEFYIDYMSWHGNIKSIALASLIATLVLPPKSNKRIVIGSHEFLFPKEILETNETNISGMNLEPRNWQFIFVDLVLCRILPEDRKEASKIKKEVEKFYYDPELGTLY